MHTFSFQSRIDTTNLQRLVNVGYVSINHIALKRIQI